MITLCGIAVFDLMFLEHQGHEGVAVSGLNSAMLEEREAQYVRWVLNRTGGNRTRAAEILGIDRVSLWRKLKNLDATE